MQVVVEGSDCGNRLDAVLALAEARPSAHRARVRAVKAGCKCEWEGCHKTSLKMRLGVLSCGILRQPLSSCSGLVGMVEASRIRCTFTETEI